ncbi:methylenetetrahydrofolate reductase [archaeon]|nr:methylenetetrahydrofolate reductase [archaeon]MBT5492093.1 methylenetetrahydrofolate reductase [bacterium]
MIYRAVSNYNESSFSNWLKEQQNKHSFVFVGSPSHYSKPQLNLEQSFKLRKEFNPNICLGGICIPERHLVKHNENLKVINKIYNGCEFFITQCVYDLEASKQFLIDYSKSLKSNNLKPAPIIFTLTPCGNKKTIDFMKWLGISIPGNLEIELKESEDILKSSLEISKSNFEELFILGNELGIPIGCNIESVSINKKEIEASIKLLYDIKDVMD